ncbi:AAA-like domain-containing protein [Anaerolineales bacterium HSG25]|nr:AAA-like domain-containing protein [Anaerolineales bacterium HSG25]
MVEPLTLTVAGLVGGFVIDVGKEMASGEMADKLVKPFLDRRTNHDIQNGLRRAWQSAVKKLFDQYCNSPAYQRLSQNDQELVDERAKLFIDPEIMNQLFMPIDDPQQYVTETDVMRLYTADSAKVTGQLIAGLESVGLWEGLPEHLQKLLEADLLNQLTFFFVEEAIKRDDKARHGFFFQQFAELRQGQEVFSRLESKLDQLLMISVQSSDQSDSSTARVFISYKRDVEPDEPIALQVFSTLNQEHYCFIDQQMLVGTHWAECLKQEIQQADFLVIFLSERSIHSEMILSEVETAYRLAKERGTGKPVILPVRLGYQGPFPHPLNIYLDRINWAMWHDEVDTPSLIEEIQQAIMGLNQSLNVSVPMALKDEPKMRQPTASAQPLRLERPEGTMDPDSIFYVEREADKIALAEIEGQGALVTIKAPRQMGKSSLLYRVMDGAEKLGKQAVLLDFQQFDEQDLAEADSFYQEFCRFVSDELDIEDDTDKYWQRPTGNNRRATRYFKRHILPKLESPLLLAMDEVERVFSTTFKNDFFGMLRSWYNDRAFKTFDMALVTSTEPHLFIESHTQSPFNVGRTVELTDFSMEQVLELNLRHESPFSSDEMPQLYALLRGHPYLTRLAFYLVAKGHFTPDTLFQRTTENYQGPFSDHLRRYLFLLQDHADLIAGLQQIINQQTEPDERLGHRLRAAGLVVRSEGDKFLPRCLLYADYFREHLGE